MAVDLCPVWAGYLLVNPLRKLFQNPTKILAPHVRAGMTTLDIGPGMGFFSLPMAELAGPSGRVVCVDLQPGMLRALDKRATEAGLAGRIETRVCSTDSLKIDDLAGRVDFILAFAVVHEIPDHPRLFRELAAALAPEGRILLSEPSGHVSPAAFAKTLEEAEKAGLTPIERPRIKGGTTVVLARA